VYSSSSSSQALFLLYAKHQPPSYLWRGFIDVLPSFGSPVAWPDEQFELLRGTTVYGTSGWRATLEPQFLANGTRGRHAEFSVRRRTQLQASYKQLVQEKALKVRVPHTSRAVPCHTKLLMHVANSLLVHHGSLLCLPEYRSRCTTGTGQPLYVPCLGSLARSFGSASLPD